MAGHQTTEGIGDDFFEQIFSMPAYGGGGGGGGEGSLTGMVLQLSSGEVGGSSSAGVGMHGPGIFPLGLSLDQSKNASIFGKSDDFREDHGAAVSSSKSVSFYLPWVFSLSSSSISSSSLSSSSNLLGFLLYLLLLFTWFYSS